jgi:hypothetical protein
MVDRLCDRGYYVTLSGYSAIENRHKYFRLELLALVAEICKIEPNFFFVKRGGVWDAGEAIKKIKGG